jgi:putative membrane protein
MRISALCLATVVSAGVGALGDATAPPAADAKFMKDAAADGKAEIQLGQLAADKASRDDVKDFGKMMVEDHKKADEELSALAAQKQVGCRPR